MLALAATSAHAAPVVSVTDSCAFAGAQFALAGSGFDPGRRTSVEIMSSADPSAGAPLTTRTVTADGGGRLLALLDVPPTDATGATDRSVRVRPDPDPALGLPTLLAAAPLRTATRGVSIRPVARERAAGATERWRITGLPDGTRMTAHYRHGRETIASVDVGTAVDPCGRMAFDLRTLPRGHERSGAWDVWLTSKQSFRVPRRGVYIKRALTVAGDGPRARVRSAAPRLRLAPSDPRASAPVTSAFAADASRIGLLSLDFVGAGGAPVDFFERVGDRLRPLGRVQAAAGEEHTILADATTWSCSRLTRHFVASATLPDGSTSSGAHAVRTPSCAGRFLIGVARRVRAGGTIAVRVVDRWGNGAITPRLCVTAPGRGESCRALPFPRAVAVATRRLRADTRGTWRLRLRGQGTRTGTSVEVGGERAVAQAAPPLLATGDSLMQGIDSFLEEDLGDAARVRSDVRPGTGISKPGTDWTQIATTQVAALKPKTTVISIGAADGFAMTPAQVAIECCGEAWVAEYTRRVSTMMQTYLQGGRGRVFWLTLPLPRTSGRLEITNAVNAAIERAAGGVAGVTVVRLDLLFSPGGYSDTIRYRGRTVNVREIDGIHLNVAGTAIAAGVIADLIRGEA